jgi:hypothetical protein
MSLPHEELRDVPWYVRATQAMADGIARAISEHKRDGLPLAVWRDGQVVWISADEAEAELAASRAPVPPVR